MPHTGIHDPFRIGGTEVCDVGIGVALCQR